MGSRISRVRLTLAAAAAMVVVLASSPVLSQGGPGRAGMRCNQGAMGGGQSAMMGQGMTGQGMMGQRMSGGMGPGMIGGGQGGAGAATGTDAAATTAAAQQLLTDLQLSPTDPAAVLAAKDKLGLTTQQVRRLQKIISQARKQTEALLSDAQKQQLAPLAGAADAVKVQHGAAARKLAAEK